MEQQLDLSKMHKIENTPKVLTIIGLIIEGIAALASIGFGLFFKVVFSSISSTLDFRDALITDGMSIAEADLMVDIFTVMADVMFIFGIVLVVVLIFNIYLFSKLINEKFTDEQAHKVYLYQAIWGGINLMFNQLTGIVYLVSGIQGYNNRPDKIKTREGL